MVFTHRLSLSSPLAVFRVAALILSYCLALPSIRYSRTLWDRADGLGLGPVTPVSIGESVDGPPASPSLSSRGLQQGVRG